MYETIRRAKVDPAKFFFTNVYVGLQPGDTAAGKLRVDKHPDFQSWCCRFLSHQIEIMQPRSVIALGRDAQRVLVFPDDEGEQTRAGVTFRTYSVRHPSASRSHAVIDAEAVIFRSAWR